MLNRRQLLTQVATVGGTGAAAAAMQAMGLFGAQAAPIKLNISNNIGAGRRVVVLGAGIAGLVAAYELEQAGYDVTVIEARTRVGGIAWTIRDGDRVELMGEASQTARFANGGYFNAGAARIPSWHEGILSYARKFKVPLEVEINASRSAYLAPSGGSRLRMRTAVNDLRGHLSELLTKAIDQGSLDQAITAQDKARLKPLLRYYGDLDGEGRFLGTKRSGLATLPGAGVSSFATAATPVSLSELLKNDMLAATVFEDDLFMQATMFQPVGGMDRIAAGIARHLKSTPLLGTEVVRLRQSRRGVEVIARDLNSNGMRSFTGDFLISTLPFTAFKRIDANFDRDIAAAIAGVQFDHAAKVAFDSPRFWEREQIYGGISFVGGETTLLWYPSSGLQDDRGVLLGAYSMGQTAKAFEQLPLATQIALSRTAIERAHPGQGEACINPLVINWSKVRYSEGPWPNWSGGHGGLQEAHIDTPAFRLLSTPRGRIAFAGAALSQTPGWQEGAVASARTAVNAIAGMTANLGATERRQTIKT